MRLLLDTCVLLWWLENSWQLGSSARAAIANGAHQVHVSAISAAEIAVKSSIGKLKAPGDLDVQVRDNDFTPLALTIPHGLQLQGLPFHHRDPFDRMLIAQAQVEGLTVVTADRAFGDYQVQVLSARE